MGYRLLDHCNARNAAEMARTDLNGRAGTFEWSPPTEDIFVTDPVDRGFLYRRFMRRHLGLGDKISCGTWVLENAIANDPACSAYNSKKGANVARPFDERHMERIAAGRADDDHSTSTEYFREIELRESLDDEKASRRVFEQKVEGLWEGGSFDVPFHEASEMGLMTTGLVGYPFTRLFIASNFSAIIDTPQTSDYCMRMHCIRVRRPPEPNDFDRIRERVTLNESR